MKIAVTSATINEFKGIRDRISSLYTGESSRLQVSFHKTGVGILTSAFALTKLIYDRHPDLIIQAGIAGSFDPAFPPGKVVAVQEEFSGDVGVEEGKVFKDVFDMNLENKDEFPYSNKGLSNPWLAKFNLLKLPYVNGVTVNEITTDPHRIQHLQNAYKADIESMEGAALHYAGLQTNTPFIQIRSISNYIGERDKSKWLMVPALNNLTSAVLEYIHLLYEMK